MTSVQLILGVLAVMVATSYGEQCIQCLGRNRGDCDVKETVECGDVGCMAISENYTVENLSFPSKLMGCAEEELCNKVIKFNTDHEMDISVYMKCCKGNLCNENIPYSFPPKCKLNGKYCESCFAENTKGECVSSKKIECRGNQHKCHSYAGKVEMPDLSVKDYSVKGCISDLGCILKFGSLIGVKQLEERVFKCSEALE